MPRDGDLIVAAPDGFDAVLDLVNYGPRASPRPSSKGILRAFAECGSNQGLRPLKRHG